MSVPDILTALNPEMIAYSNSNDIIRPAMSFSLYGHATHWIPIIFIHNLFQPQESSRYWLKSQIHPPVACPDKSRKSWPQKQLAFKYSKELSIRSNFGYVWLGNPQKSITEFLHYIICASICRSKSVRAMVKPRKSRSSIAQLCFSCNDAWAR